MSPTTSATPCPARPRRRALAALATPSATRSVGHDYSAMPATFSNIRLHRLHEDLQRSAGDYFNLVSHCRHVLASTRKLVKGELHTIDICSRIISNDEQTRRHKPATSTSIHANAINASAYKATQATTTHMSDGTERHHGCYPYFDGWKLI